MSGSVVDPSRLSPDIQHQDKVRLDANSNYSHIASVRSHAWRNGPQYLLHCVGCPVGDFGS